MLPLCHTQYHEGSALVDCENKGAETCHLLNKRYRQLKKEPCCLAIFIPARYLTENKTVQKAAEKYIDDCLCTLE